jgi:type II secretory pathway component PulM
MTGKLHHWRNKSAREKHVLALTGAAIITSIIALFVVVNFLSSLDQPEKAITGTPAPSPFAQIKQLFTANQAASPLLSTTTVKK